MSIKRPAILFLLTTILGIIVAYGRVPVICMGILVSVAIFLLLKLFFDKKITLKVLCIVLIFFLVGYFRFTIDKVIYDNYNAKIESIGKGYHKMTGVVNMIGKSTNSNYFVLTDCKIEGKKLGTCRCYFNNYEDDVNGSIKNNIKIGNLIEANCNVKIYDEPQNEGEFNQPNYYRSIGVSFFAFAKDFDILNDKTDVLRQKIYETKINIKSQIEKIWDEKDAGLFSAMITGDKSSIDKAQKKLFNDNGIAHILAISGLHLSILGLFLFEFLRKFLSVNASAGIVGVFIFLYGIFIDAGATSLRAISMLYVRFISLCLGKTYDSKNVLYIICFIFLMINPYLLFNAGFQFSYVAIFALNHETEFKYYKKINANCGKIKIPAVIILTLFLFPITVYSYFTYPLYSILLNLIVIPLMSFVLGFGLISLGISFIFLNVSQTIGISVHLIFMLYEKLCHFISDLPYSRLVIGKPNIMIIVIYYIVLLSGIYIINNHTYRFKENENIDSISKNIDIISISKMSIVCVLLIVSFVLFFNKKTENFRVTFLSVGQGDSILIEAKDKVISIDGGSSSNTSVGQYVISPHIKSRAIDHIDYMFISHSDADHINGVSYILQSDDDIKVYNMYLPLNAKNDISYDKLKEYANENGTSITYIKEGDEFNFDIDKNNDIINIKVLSPDEYSINNNIKKNGKSIYDVNNFSEVFKLSYNNHSILFTGDVGKDMMNRIIKDDYDKKNLKSEVYKVAHHGSKNSNLDKFYELVKPKYAVVSYGIGNSYGHPHKVTIDSLSKSMCNIIKVPETGQVDMYFDKEKIYYKTFR